MKPRVYQCQRCTGHHWMVSGPAVQGVRRQYDGLTTWAEAMQQARNLARWAGVRP
jgi:hypothetical protein